MKERNIIILAFLTGVISEILWKLTDIAPIYWTGNMAVIIMFIQCLNMRFKTLSGKLFADGLILVCIGNICRMWSYNPLQFSTPTYLLIIAISVIGYWKYTLYNVPRKHS